MTTYWQAMFYIQGIIIMEVGLRNKISYLKKKISKEWKALSKMKIPSICHYEIYFILTFSYQNKMIP